MELFKILGTVAINIDEASAGLDKVTDMAEKTRHKTAQAFGKIGDVAIKTGKVVASGLAIGATAMSGLATKALKLGGELEQNRNRTWAALRLCLVATQKKCRRKQKMPMEIWDFLLLTTWQLQIRWVHCSRVQDLVSKHLLT